MLYKEKILIIHKSKVNREKIAVYLRELQYAVIIAENAEETYNLAKSPHPDLILWGTPITIDGQRVLKFPPPIEINPEAFENNCN